jgi:hypothetical protein
MLAYVVEYILVALSSIGYRWLRYGPWLSRGDFMFNVAISALWPLSFTVLAIMWAIDSIREWAYGGDLEGL